MGNAICRELLDPGAGQKEGTFVLTHAARATKPCLLSGSGGSSTPLLKAEWPGPLAVDAW